MQPIDWNATAAWIALAISIVGTIVSPLITTCLTNRHQIQLRELDIQRQASEKYEERRFEAISAFLHSAGSCFARFDAEGLEKLGADFHHVYQYVPDSLWAELDTLYIAIIDEDYRKTKELYPPIARHLSEILKEVPQLHP